MHAIEHTYVSLLADVARLSGFSEIRGSYEGLQWCLNEAPKLEKLMLEAIEVGREPDLDRYPAWLQRLAAGAYKDPVLLRYLRQLLLFCYKASVTHDKATTEKAFQQFVETNRDIGIWGNRLNAVSPRLLDIARRHCQSVLYRFRERELNPSHGPGAVTTDKDRWQHLYSTIEYLYPYSDWFCPYANRDAAEHWEYLEHKDIIQAKLIAVPKDSRGPRLICVHPAESIWIQQGLRRELERAITLRRYASGPWPSGRIQFDSQESNGSIALNSSRSRRYATIDMKEASDRISEPLVQILFGRKYKWFGACRAQEFIIPKVGGLTNVRGQVNCYAPMGNATTFPVQSLVFWSICVAALQSHGFHQPGAVFVFGDDIIIPTECAEVVVDALESFGLLVNRTKSFWRGGFRESCGVDAFNGVNVTPVRWKTTFDAEYHTGMQSLSDIAMRLRVAGYEDSSVMAYSILRKRLKANNGSDLFTTNNRNHGGLAEFVTNDTNVWRDAYWHRDLQKFVSPVTRLETLEPRFKGYGWNRVLESLCSLERSGRSSIPVRSFSRKTRLSRGWIDVDWPKANALSKQHRALQRQLCNG
jgi:hypothetical protein